MSGFAKFFFVLVVLMMPSIVGHTLEAGNFSPIPGAEITDDPADSDPFAYFPVYSDDEYKVKMQNATSGFQIPVTYNSYVRAFIHVYTLQKRDLSERILGKKDIYFPIFEQTFAKHGLPDEFKYLAVCESALNTHATSRAGAVGLWQFMKATGKEYGLTINNYVDERRDPHKSTDAAAHYFKKMYRKYGDWLLVIAAYNCGPGNVNKAIRRSGGKRDFWSIRKYLPRETRGYVPSFMACVYWLNNHYDHHLNVMLPLYSHAYSGSDTVLVHNKLHFDAISQFTGISKDELMFLNPELKKEVIPQSYQAYPLRIPYFDKHIFHTNKYFMYERMREPDMMAKVAYANNYSSYYRSSYYTPPGAYVGGSTTISSSGTYTYSTPGAPAVGISDSYTMETKDQVLNNTHSIPAATTMAATTIPVTTTSYTTTSAIPPPRVEIPKPKPAPKKTGPPAGTTAITYTIKNGDNLGFISEWFNTSSSKLRAWNGIRGNSIRAGKKLKIYVPSGKTSYYKELDKLSFDQKQSRTKGGSASKSTTTTSSSTSTKSATSIETYTIKNGDNLWEITKKFPANTITDLQKLNGLKKGAVLQPGMKIKVKK